MLQAVLWCAAAFFMQSGHTWQHHMAAGLHLWACPVRS